MYDNYVDHLFVPMIESSEEEYYDEDTLDEGATWDKIKNKAKSAGRWVKDHRWGIGSGLMGLSGVGNLANGVGAISLSRAELNNGDVNTKLAGAGLAGGAFGAGQLALSKWMYNKQKKLSAKNYLRDNDPEGYKYLNRAEKFKISGLDPRYLTPQQSITIDNHR